MAKSDWGEIYKELGAHPVINATGSVTMLGGSTPIPEVREAMDRAHEAYIPLMELQDRAGKYIADMTDVPAAYLTSGAGSALTLATAAIMAGDDDDKIQQLPDTTGMKNEILIQRRQRYWYDRCLELAGARLVEFGTDDATSREDLESAIGPSTAAVHFYAVEQSPDADALSLEDTIEIAHGAGVSVAVVFDADFGDRGRMLREGLPEMGGRILEAGHWLRFVGCGRDIVGITCGTLMNAQIVIHGVLDGLVPAAEPRGGSLKLLSPREREVLGWMSRGYRNGPIARILHLEPKTVERHINNIYAKLGECPAGKHPRVQAISAFLTAAGYRRQSWGDSEGDVPAGYDGAISAPAFQASTPASSAMEGTSSLDGTSQAIATGPASLSRKSPAGRPRAASKTGLSSTYPALSA